MLCNVLFACHCFGLCDRLTQIEMSGDQIIYY